MDYSYFVGIDVSKLTLDITILNSKGKMIEPSFKIENTLSSFKVFTDLLIQKLGNLSNALFCLEPTGHYSNLTVSELVKNNYLVWLASGASIQKSIGLTRGKNDKIDSYRIAEYAFRFSDKASLVVDNDIQNQQLRELLTQRESFVTTKAGYAAQIKDFKGYVSEESYQIIKELNLKLIENLLEAISIIEQKIEVIILNEQQLKRQYELLQTIPGIGKVLSQTIIASTAGFTRFNNPRAFACHAGIAPFTYTSGTSVKSRSRVSHRANKRLKSLLHLASLCCIRVNGELKEYYLRKTNEGKSKMSVLNAIRNKIVHRIFAVIKRNSSYKNLVIS